MRRREVILAGMSLPLAGLVGGSWLRVAAAAPADAATPFDDGTVPTLARELAARPFQPPDRALPPALDRIGYDQYRDYRYKADRALWRDAGLPFQAQFFHRGFLHKDRVDIYTVRDGKAAVFAYATDQFTYGRSPVPQAQDLGFAGFRLHAPINRPDYFDEVAVFLGASYFRAVGKGQAYGLSARGLALNTGDPQPEEFPVFKAFWLERPAPGADAVVVHALLDSPSAAAAFRFSIRPGVDTIFDVDMHLYPRVELAHAGIAPLTSMFDFDASDRLGIDDYRPAVHDSDGLAMLNGRGEQVWRPLQNPRAVQMSAFQDENPRGFGLMQRKRAFTDYLDLEADYQKRPSLWVEPRDDWGKGGVILVEIPTADEYHDNIVAFWRPQQALAAGSEHRFRYRLHWGRDHAWQPELAVVASTRIGKAAKAGVRLMVIELAGGRLAKLPADAKPQVDALASKGELRNAVAYHNPENGHWRMSFELDPRGQSDIELRARLTDASGPLSETWLYRWNG
ncbi:glucans biosynthesis protein [Luteimonas cucumeris]|uniref:Glucans biosynthesis protein D n=1 Tax=Luteimonas cucumeris TaxID=985012 RepID=A0A562L293_9GAMM|nr:glucan biosynthesis protein G [Luteimonas cucumeris]TWI01748.1 glucans biosynthesis protein [Luteimonas cucumeris]